MPASLRLGAVATLPDHIGAAGVELGAAGHRRDVRPGIRFAQCKCRDQFASRHAGKVLRLLRGAAGQRDGATAKALHGERKVRQR